MDIDPKDVPESAKETCHNWMYKMASIRELLPRLYMEMTLLKCYVFIAKEDIKPTISRITTMIRGIGSPLVATYLRLYLCKVASKLLGKESDNFFYNNLLEFIEDYQQVSLKSRFSIQLCIFFNGFSFFFYESIYMIPFFVGKGDNPKGHFNFISIGPC